MKHRIWVFIGLFFSVAILSGMLFSVSEATKLTEPNTQAYPIDSATSTPAPDPEISVTPTPLPEEEADNCVTSDRDHNRHSRHNEHRRGRGHYHHNGHGYGHNHHHHGSHNNDEHSEMLDCLSNEARTAYLYISQKHNLDLENLSQKHQEYSLYFKFSEKTYTVISILDTKPKNLTRLEEYVSRRAP